MYLLTWHRRAPRLGAGVVMLGAVALLVLGMDALSALSPADRLDLTMDFDRVPYLHRNPDGVRFGGACRLTRYELSSETVEAGETVTAPRQAMSSPCIVVQFRALCRFLHIPCVGSTSTACRCTLRR